MERLSGLPYGEKALQRYDLIARPDGPDRPLVVFVHGGGWFRGTRASVRQIAPDLLAAGFSVASIDYPLWPEATPLEAAQSIAEALVYFGDLPEGSGVDSRRIALVGHSAGAHLALLSASLSDTMERIGPDVLDAIVLLDGHGFDPNGPLARPHARVFDGLADQASPVARIETSNPPELPKILVSWGDDRRITRAQSRRLIAVLDEAGADYVALPQTGMSHGAFITEFAAPDTEFTNSVVDFLSETLGPVLPCRAR